MNNRQSIATLALILVVGCAGPESTSQLEAEANAVKERIAQAQEERKSHGKGSVVHDLITLRIAIHEQTLAMLEQRRSAGKARVTLSYSVDGKPYRAPADAPADAKRLEHELKQVRAGRDLTPWLRDRNYADFSDESCYEDSLQRLLKALRRKAE